MTRQDYPVSDMRFSVPQLVSRISRDMTLEPGDLILCGTSIGAGSMKSGSTVEGRTAPAGAAAASGLIERSMGAHAQPASRRCRSSTAPAALSGLLC